MATIRIIFAQGSESLDVTPLGSSLYRLEESPVLSHSDDEPLFWQDMVELRSLGADDAFQYVRLHGRGPYRHLDVVLWKAVIDSPELTHYLAMLETVGGYWERLMGGLLWLHVPQHSAIDLRSDLDAIYAAVRTRLSLDPTDGRMSGPTP